MQFGKNNSTFVAIWMVTYNHELYIKQAIQSILMQKTSFRYKLFIGEDFSTDSTREICIQYAKEFPGKIELILQEKNIGAILNAERTYKKCLESGAKYIAMLEGDDYWTDPYKLQKQIDILENNNNLSLSFHNTQIIFDYSNIPSTKVISSYYRNNLILDTNNLILFDTNICTSSMVFRTDAIKYIPLKVFVNQTGEKSLQLILSLYGNFNYINETMSVYRSNVGGISYGITKYKATKLLLNLYNSFNQYTNGVYKKSIDKKKKSIILEYEYSKFLKKNTKLNLYKKPYILLSLLSSKIEKFFYKVNKMSWF